MNSDHLFSFASFPRQEHFTDRAAVNMSVHWLLGTGSRVGICWFSSYVVESSNSGILPSIERGTISYIHCLTWIFVFRVCGDHAQKYGMTIIVFCSRTSSGSVNWFMSLGQWLDNFSECSPLFLRERSLRTSSLHTSVHVPPAALLHNVHFSRERGAEKIGDEESIFMSTMYISTLCWNIYWEKSHHTVFESFLPIPQKKVLQMPRRQLL